MLIKTIDDYLKTVKREKRQIHCFHPSSLHKSTEELYHLYLHGDDQQEFEPRILRVFDNGHAVHARIQDYLKDAGILKQAEVPVKDTDYEIEGHADGIIEIQGIEGVLEIKSMNQNQFYSAYEPKPDHLTQINVYMYCLGIPRGCLLYECKDNQELKEFYVKQDNTILNPILEKIRDVQKRLTERAEQRHPHRWTGVNQKLNHLNQVSRELTNAGA